MAKWQVVTRDERYIIKTKYEGYTRIYLIFFLSCKKLNKDIMFGDSILRKLIILSHN